MICLRFPFVRLNPASLKIEMEFLFCNFLEKLSLSYLNYHKNMVINKSDLFLIILMFRDEIFLKKKPNFLKQSEGSLENASITYEIILLTCV